jgi:hypothetical protein
MTINVILRDDYTVVSSDYTQEEINLMLDQLDWYAIPAGVGYVSVTFYTDNNG